MGFISKADACQKNGKVKKGFKVITDKNGRERYMTDTKPKDDKKGVKKVRKKNTETEEDKSKGVSNETGQIDTDEGLTLHF